MDDLKHELKALKTKYEVEASAKDVAAKSIGKHGLMYITLIVLVGVVSSLYLEEAKIAAVIGLLSAALTALIAMLSGISDAETKVEFEIIRLLIDKLDGHMNVDVGSDRVVVVKGETLLAADKQSGG